MIFFFFSSRRRHTRYWRDWSSDVCSSDLFGPGAAAEYEEAERLLNLVGVEVNARVPLGATVEGLRRLPRAWGNVLLYREVGETATLHLQDEHGVGRVKIGRASCRERV